MVGEDLRKIRINEKSRASKDENNNKDASCFPHLPSSSSSEMNNSPHTVEFSYFKKAAPRAIDDRPGSHIYPSSAIGEKMFACESTRCLTPTFNSCKAPPPRTRFPGFSLFTCQPVIRFATTCCLPERRSLFEDTGGESR